MKTPLRIHIVPAGKDEIERMYYPVELMHADKVYYIRNQDELETHLNTTEPLKKELIKIVGKSNFIEKFCDFYDLNSMMVILAEICREDKKNENSIFINLAGGTNITLAGMLAAQLFGGIPYFLKRDYKNNRYLKDSTWILEPKVYPVKKPEKDLIQFISRVIKKADKNKTDTVTKKDCVEIMIKLDNLDDISNKNSSKYYNRLKSHYLNKLADFQYLKVNPLLGGEVTILSEGRFASTIFGIFYETDSGKK